MNPHLFHGGPLRLRWVALLRHWHRRIGLAACVFLGWLAISGIALNEAVPLRLDAVHIGWPWLMNWYGLQPDGPAFEFNADGHWLGPLGEDTVFDGHRLQPAIHEPRGMAAAGGLLYVATPDSLVVLQPDGRRVDELRRPPLPVDSIHRIGSRDDRIVIEGEGAIYSSADGEAWTADAANGVAWSAPAGLPPDQARTQLDSGLRPSLPLARILADAHSGRLFGRYGPAVINLVGLAALLLAISGVSMYFRATRRQHSPRRLRRPPND